MPGFVPLRQQCGMNMWRPPAKRDLSDDAQANIARIQEIWTDARARFGAGGPFLFGKFSRRRRDVCAGGVALRDLRDRRERAGRKPTCRR